MRTVVLNADYTYLNTVPLEKAIKLIVKEKAKAIKESDRQICNAEKTCVMNVPLVLRLLHMVQTVYRNKVPWSRKNLFVRDGYRCQYCGTKHDLSVDHVIPESRGGKTSFENCVVACKTCNIIKKRDRTPEEAGLHLRKPPHEPSVAEFLMAKMKNIGVYDFLKEMGVY